MPTPVLCCGFECGVVGSHFLLTAGSVAISTTTVEPSGGSRSLRCNGTAANSQASTNLAAAATRFVGRVYVYFATLPSADCAIITTTNALATGPSVRFKSADSKLYAAVGTGSGVSGVAVTTGTWYRIDFDFNINTSGNDTSDVQVDGSSCAQATGTGVSASTAVFFLGGLTGTTTHDIFYDHLILSNTGADYPIGAGKVLGFVPASDGTHTSTSTNITKGTTGTPVGTAITSATTDSFNWVNAQPIGGGATDNTRLINQQTASSAQYVEHGIEQTSEAAAPRAVEVLGVHREAGTQGCVSLGKVNDNGTENTVFTVSAGSTSDVYATKQYALMPADSAAWTLARFKALKLRYGYSSDATPDVYLRGWMVEAEFAAATSTPLTQACSDDLNAAF